MAERLEEILKALKDSSSWAQYKNMNEHKLRCPYGCKSIWDITEAEWLKLEETISKWKILQKDLNEPN